MTQGGHRYVAPSFSHHTKKQYFLGGPGQGKPWRINSAAEGSETSGIMAGNDVVTALLEWATAAGTRHRFEATTCLEASRTAWLGRGGVVRRWQGLRHPVLDRRPD